MLNQVLVLPVQTAEVRDAKFHVPHSELLNATLQCCYGSPSETIPVENTDSCHEGDRRYRTSPPFRSANDATVLQQRRYIFKDPTVICFFIPVSLSLKLHLGNDYAQSMGSSSISGTLK